MLYQIPISGRPQYRLGEPLQKYLARVADIISFVRGTQELADITYAYGAWRLGRVPVAQLLNSLSASAQETLKELLSCHSDDLLTQLSSDAKTVLLAHLVASALAVKRFPETASLKRVSDMSARWELLRGGNANLWNALGIILQNFRSLPLGKRAQQSPFARKAGEARQHYRCYTCKKVFHFSEFVSMVGQPSRKNHLCAPCYWTYENERLSDREKAERGYREFYQAKFGSLWDTLCDPNGQIYLTYQEFRECPYCSQALPPFSFAERRRIWRKSTKLSIAEPWYPCTWRDFRQGYHGAEPDYLEYLEHGGARTQSNSIWVCSDCKAARGATRFCEWILARPEPIKNKLRELFHRSLGRYPESVATPLSNEICKKWSQLRSFESELFWGVSSNPEYALKNPRLGLTYARDIEIKNRHWRECLPAYANRLDFSVEEALRLGEIESQIWKTKWRSHGD